MYKKIMVPVDLEHTGEIEKALDGAAELAKSYAAPVCFVAVTGRVPNEVAPSPDKFAAELNMFAREQGDRHGIETSSHVVQSVDVTVELHDKLIETIHEIGADLVVMASHVPTIADRLHLIGSNAAYIVEHTDISVFVVR